MNTKNVIKKIAVVVPVYYGSATVEELTERLIKTITALGCLYEIILVDDRSPDDSWEKIKKLNKTHKDVIGIRLSRNFGQHYAITAGLEHANADWVVVMDCDLQDVPEEIEKLHKKALEGVDIVLAVRKHRKDSFIKRITSKLFYKVFNYLTGSDYNFRVANYGIYKLKVIKAVLDMNDYVRFFPIMCNWVGFHKEYVEVSHNNREDGKSTYTWRALFKLAFMNIVSFSDKLLSLAIRIGMLVTLLSVIFMLVTLYKYLTGRIIVLGYTSLLISIFFFSGIIISFIGIVGKN